MRIAQVAARYRDARLALLHLHPLGKWTGFFKDLKKEDVRGPGHGQGTSESWFIHSWIWTLRASPTPPDVPGPLSPPAAADDLASIPSPVTPLSTPDNGDSQVLVKEVEEYILSDWAKAHEHAKRFEEGVEICMEEMWWTLFFFSWHALEWEKHAQARAHSDKPPSGVLQGLQAYTYCQSVMYHQLIEVFINDWSNCLEPKGLSKEWLANYSDLITSHSGRNTVPSIIPPIQQDKAEVDDTILSDQDEALELLEEVAPEQDAESELHDNLVQIMAEG